MIVPEPPSVLTPPTTAAAIAASSRPGAGGDVDRAEAPDVQEPGEPGEGAAGDEGGELQPARRSRPAWRAASGFEPRAYRWRPAARVLQDEVEQRRR